MRIASVQPVYQEPKVSSKRGQKLKKTKGSAPKVSVSATLPQVINPWMSILSPDESFTPEDSLAHASQEKLYEMTKLFVGAAWVHSIDFYT